MRETKPDPVADLAADMETNRKAERRQVVVREIERCRSVIERARAEALELDKRFPGCSDELESALQKLVCLAARIDPDKPKGPKPKKGKKDKRRKEEERPTVSA